MEIRTPLGGFRIRSIWVEHSININCPDHDGDRQHKPGENLFQVFFGNSGRVPIANHHPDQRGEQKQAGQIPVDCQLSCMSKQSGHRVERDDRHRRTNRFVQVDPGKQNQRRDNQESATDTEKTRQYTDAGASRQQSQVAGFAFASRFAFFEQHRRAHNQHQSAKYQHQHSLRNQVRE